MLQVKDFTFTNGDLVQRKFGGYQITYKMTAAQKTAFKTFLGDAGKEELAVHNWLQTNNIAVVNQPANPAQDVPDGTNNEFESVITAPGQAPLIKTKGEDPVPTVGDARGTPVYDGTDFEVEEADGSLPDTSVPKDADKK